MRKELILIIYSNLIFCFTAFSQQTSGLLVNIISEKNDVVVVENGGNERVHLKQTESPYKR